MGRKTWESLNNKPLKDRLNIVITKSPISTDSTVKKFKSLNSALEYCYTNKQISNNFVIGGESIFKEAIKRPDCKELHLTEVTQEYPSDTFFPPIPKWFKPEITETNPGYDFLTYTNMLNLQSEENQYLQCLKRIIETGEPTIDRTKVGTLSVFDENFKFDITTQNPNADPKDHIYKVPVLTTKKLYLNGVIWELIWFLNGNTDAKWLQDRNVHIWDGHSSKEYLKSINLNYPPGHIGPGYGHQWINWGGDWKTQKGGINQIVKIIEELKKNPTSRRAVLSAWNVEDIPKMALPPCHVMYIFKVSDHNTRKKLNCKMIIRSNDMFLGSPFNILSTALLTILMSRALNMLPGSIAISITDAHIYQNHIEQVKSQLERIPYEFPKLQIGKDINSWEDMCKLTAQDFKFTDYYCWDSIKADMAV
jgi:dihydrofolate reductase / thymidylate synthase